MTGSQGNTGAQGGIGITGMYSGSTGVINIVLGGGLTVLETGIKGNITLPFNLTFDSWELTAGETGSILLGLWRSSYANYPPTSSSAMHSGATGPAIIDGIKNYDTDLSDWGGVTGSYGDHVCINVDSISTIKNCSLSIKFHRN